jgi:hypothetical protein
MCYAVYLSTDSAENLSARNSELIKFDKIDDRAADPAFQFLEFPNRWYVGSESGCSCTFRHLMSSDLGFGEPVDWYHEDEDQIQATKELYATVENLLRSGHRLDLVDRWEGDKPADIINLVVSLDDISETTFRMFENHKFIFVIGKPPQVD